MVALNVSCIEFVKMIRSQFPIGTLVLEHMVNDHQESMSDRHNGFLLPSANHQPMVKSRQIRPLLSSGCPSGLRQIATQPSVSLSGLPAFALARTFIVPRTKPR